MRFAYADPPYVGQAKKHYGPDAKEVNHRVLLCHLDTFEAWAMSCSSVSLQEILLLCPVGVRVGAWVKPFASFKPGVNPGYCWEPVIFWGGRKLGRDVPTVRDYVSANITLKRGTHGAKPDAFWFWIFQMLGVDPGDEFTDLFPGSSGGLRTWERFCTQGVCA